MKQRLFNEIQMSLIDGDDEQTQALTTRALAAGLEPLEIIREALMPGMHEVGDKFSCGDFFLPDLIMASEAMQKAMALLEPELARRSQSLETPGVVVIGTVHGDIHAIGKNLVATLLAANGFKVIDLGVDVPVEKFVAAVRTHGANLVGMSALLTTTMTQQRETLHALEQAGLRSQVKVMIGGAPVTKSWAEEIGADGYAEDAMGAVTLAQRLVEA